MKALLSTVMAAAASLNVAMVFSSATPAFAQTLSPDHEQLCKVVMAGRLKVYPLGDAYNKESNPIAKRDLLKQFQSAVISSNDSLQAFLVRPLQEIAGIIDDFGGVSGTDVIIINATVQCDKAALGVFSMRFGQVTEDRTTAIGPFVSTLRSLKKGDRISFSGNVYGGPVRHKYSYTYPPERFYFELVTTMLRKL